MDQIYGLDFIVQVHTIDDDSMDTFQIEYIPRILWLFIIWSLHASAGNMAQKIEVFRRPLHLFFFKKSKISTDFSSALLVHLLI